LKNDPFFQNVGRVILFVVILGVYIAGLAVVMSIFQEGYNHRLSDNAKYVPIAYTAAFMGAGWVLFMRKPGAGPKAPSDED
jgi:hypothetical protein